MEKRWLLLEFYKESSLYEPTIKVDQLENRSIRKLRSLVANGGHRVKALGGRADVGQANLAEVFFARLTRKACFLANFRFDTAENEPAKNL